MKNNKGITLIALVITIIVLLILAGVAIAMLTGENSVLKRASDSKYVNEIGAVKDQVSLAAAEGIANYYEGKYVTSPASEDSILKTVYTEVKNVTGNTYVDVNVTPTTLAEDATEATVEVVSKDDNTIKSTGTINSEGLITWKDNFKSAK